ncbi:hypothetical protein LMH87_010314 [Akanthomyces muscarius]|uniref:Uncharacterized protein n=1 Tax=Akanthomyces muscarius TaxID=2231603 RepID=A0A9W8QGE7_AKAMU|nr:hypothetical protein LMH87_010314 [Akanthomyces muscarius]KAJ4153844.1 hypothetical protein LMH87_010314 [Akanthomyces muscarius]
MLLQTLLSVTVTCVAVAQAAPRTGILARLWDEPDASGSHEDIRNINCHNLIRLAVFSLYETADILRIRTLFKIMGLSMIPTFTPSSASLLQGPKTLDTMIQLWRSFLCPHRRP